MIVSRADIRYDKFENFEKPFLIFPPENYLNELNIEANNPQIAIINGINNPKYRFGVAAIARRLGKTFIANVIGQLVVLNPGCQILVVAPNYSLSQISWDLQHQLVKQFGIETTRDNAKDKVLELINGSSVRVGSVNQIDSVVGRSYDFVIFDEAALSDAGEDAFNIAIFPTLDKPNSKALFISTPRGKQNWFSKFYDRGFDPKFPQWFSVKATWKDNPRMDPEIAAEAARGMSKQEFRQEFEADFSVFEGRIWTIDDDRDIINELPEDLDLRDCDIIAGLDLGYRDPTAFCVLAFDRDKEIFYIIDEYLDAEKTTAKQAERIRAMLEEHEIEIIYIDSANQQQRFDFAETYGIPSDNADKSDKLGAIGYVASLMENGKVKILSHCTECLYAISQYKWDSNTNLLKEKPVHDKASHMADAIRYALYSYEKVSLDA